MKRYLLYALLGLPVLAAAKSKVPARPKLVIGIVVDQMRWDYLYRYQDHYGADGFNRLLRDGFSCQQTFLNYIPSYTAPGHASIYSGTYPALHGITGNDWIDRLSARAVYCCEDTSVISLGGSKAAGQMSPRNMAASTVGDELRLATNFRSRVFGVSLKDRGAILPAGHTANTAYWFDDSTGGFITSSYYCPALPSWVKQFNALRLADSLLSQPWTTLLPSGSYRQSIADDNQFEYVTKGETSPVFPHIFKTGDYKALRRSPHGNKLSFLFAEELILKERLGQNACDMLALSLSATDYVGHAYAPNAVEVEDMYLRLDRQLASFFKFLDDYAGAGNYLVFLTADHGAAHNAAWLEEQQIPAGTLSETMLCKELNQSLYRQFRIDSLVTGVFNYQVVLNENRILEKRLNRNEVKAAIKSFCITREGVAYAVDLEHLSEETLPAPIRELIVNGYYARRCGAVALIYNPAWYSDGKKGTTHGTWNPYDRHIPLLWYGWHIPAGSSYAPVNVTDIAVTLSALLHIQMPNAATGKVIEVLMQ